MPTVQYELLRPQEIVRERLRLPLVFLPIGPLEWHGPHLPLGMDGLHAHTVAVETAQRTGGVVLPTYFIGTETVRPTAGGPQSSTVLGFAGTERIVGMDFPENPVKSLYFEEGVFAVTVRELLRLAARDGYRLIVIVNGHGAVNHQRALRRLADEASDPPRARVVFTMAFLPAEPPFSDPGHAEKVETSIVLATRPELVDLAALPPKTVPLRYVDYGIVDGKAFDGHPTPDFTVPPEADPRDASAVLGRAMLDAEVDRLVAVVSAEARSLGFGRPP
jgi:creatinine amidohydrolase